MRFRRYAIPVALAVAAASACYVGPVEKGEAGPTTGKDPTEPDPSSPNGSDAESSGLPCDVDALLTKSCRGCHVTGGKSPMPLMTYEDLSAPSTSDPSKNVATASIERMRSDVNPMPPSPSARVANADLVVFERWVADGMPRGECGGSTSEPTSVCTSDTFWTSNRKGPSMQPGRACITCHEKNEDDPIVWVGGTVYPTLREPDGCYGVPGGGVEVVITDAAGRVVTLPVGSTGNFSLSAESSANLTMPFRAKVVHNGASREMKTPQSSGDCNACHTENGANGAPGRILVP